MSLNKVVTSVNALTNNVNIPNNNNVVCIDTNNNRIGVKTATPSTEIDVNGTVKTKNLYLNQTNSSSNYDIDYDNTHLRLSKSLSVNIDLSCNSNINSNNIITNDLSCIRAVIGDLSINNTLNSTANISLYTPLGTKNTEIKNDGSIDTYIINVQGMILPTTNNNSSIGNFNKFWRQGFITDLSINNNLDVIGNITHTNGTLISSDDRFKHNEILITNGLEVIKKLVPQKYQKTSTFKHIDFSGLLTDNYITEAGLIAQEVNDISDLKFTVYQGDDNTPYYLNYNNIFVYSLAAIKELESKFNELNNNIEDLSNNINLNKINSENINIYNLESIINNQNKLIELLNNKITSLENRLVNIENNF